MKKLLLPALLLLLVAEFGFGQTNYYRLSTDSLYSELRIRAFYESMKKNMPKEYVVKPTIYHKIVSKDSIINYMAFYISKSDSIIKRGEFELSFKQDSLFLLLNHKLPAFKLKDLDGNEFSSSQLIGKPALLNYWAVWCWPCVEEMPELSKLKEKYGKEMNFIALTENKTSEDDLISFLKVHPYNYYLLQNAEDYKKVLKIGALPSNIFIDKYGYVRNIQGNYPIVMDPKTGKKTTPPNNYFVQVIEELIKEK